MITVALCSSVYYVTPHDYNPASTNVFTLQHYLNYTKKYFNSHTKLCFQPGEHYLTADIVLNDITEFMLVGIGHSTINCASDVSIVAINATKCTMQNITLKDCGKDHSVHINVNDIASATDPPANYNASILLLQCNSVKVDSITINTNAGFIALLLFNLQESSKVIDMKVRVNCFKK